MPRSRRRLPFLLIFLVTWGLTTHGKYSVSGDEPHYLIIAESLLSDGDLDLDNNYRNNDGRHFGHDGLVNDGHARLTPAGRLESAHDIGLPVLLLPAYAAARWAGTLVSPPILSRIRMTRGLFVYSLVSLTLIAAVAWSCLGLLTALEAAWPDRRVPYLLYLIALSPPVISHAFLVFPETVMFVITCAVLAAAVRGGRHGAGLARLAPIALALGCAPWLHRKFTPFALALALAYWWTTRKGDAGKPSPLQALALMALALVPAALFFVWSWEHWGTLLGPQFASGSRLELARLPVGLLGLFADRGSGLLSYAPLYLVIPACLALATATHWPWLLAAATLVLPMATFDEWWGGFAPAARYLVPVIPILAVCIAHGLQHQRVRLAVIALGVLQIAIDVIVWQRPRLLWPDASFTNAALTRLWWIGDIWRSLLPAVRTGATTGSVVGFLLLTTAATLAILGRRRPSNPAAATG